MKIGDKVKFLSETGGGKIAGFQGKNIVLVEDEDGFQIPTPVNEVVVVGGGRAESCRDSALAWSPFCESYDAGRSGRGS